MTKSKVTEIEQYAMLDQLKGAQRIDLNAILKSEVEFYHNMRARFGKDKIVDETEKRVRDLFRVFAKAANEAFPHNKQIGEGSIGLLTEPLEYYDFILLVNHKESLNK